MTNILNTRAVLMLAPAFAESDTDPNGNPIVWVNRYSCLSCTSEQIDWASLWSSICDEDCPNCGNARSPYESVWMGPKEPTFRRIWESLPEAGNDNRAKTAAEVKKLIDEMDADPDFADIPKAEAVLKAEKMLDFSNEITQRSAPAWAWDMIDGLLGLGLGDAADLSAVAMKFATENPEYAEITREDAKRAAGVL